MRMLLADGDPGWWGYAEKDAWYTWAHNHTREGAAIQRLVSEVMFTVETCADPVLTSGVQVEGLYLRVAELLGLHSPVTRTATT